MATLTGPSGSNHHEDPKPTTHLTDPSGDSLEIVEVEDPSLPWSSRSHNILRFIKSGKGKRGEINTEEAETFHDIDINDDVDNDKEPPSFIDKTPYMSYLRYIKTGCIFVSFFALGICMALLGPSLLDLAYYTKSSIHEMSYVFTSRSVGYLLGSIIGGWMYDKYDSYLILGAVCLGGTLFIVVFPIVTNIYGLVAIGCIFAAMGGALDTDGNAQIIVLWPKNGPVMQFLHFTYAFGAFVAPLLAKPFLLPQAITNPTATPTGNTLNMSANTTSVLGNNSTSHHDTILPLTWAYVIAAVPLAASGVLFLSFSFVKACKEPYTKKAEQGGTKSKQGGTAYKVILMTLFTLLLLQYVGMETVYGGFVFSFAVKAKPPLTKDTAALLNAAYWGTFSFGRLAAVPAAKFLKPVQMIIGAFIGTLTAGIILVSQSIEGCYVASSDRLWVGTVLLGISAASVFPSTISWTESYLDVTGRTASILLVGSCVGDMIVPVAVGNTFDSTGPCTLMYSVLGLSVLSIFLAIAIALFARYHTKFGFSTGSEFHNRSNRELVVPPKPQSDNPDTAELLDK